MIKQKPQESEITNAFKLVAIDICEPLRQISDKDGKIGPPQIKVFQGGLIITIAKLYYGTHERLKDIDN